MLIIYSSSIGTEGGGGGGGGVMPKIYSFSIGMGVCPKFLVSP